MRLLIYGMQSSGASTLALLLAQKPECSAFADIWTMYVAPTLPADRAVVAKVVVTTAFPLALHQERFRPDRTILFLRHPQVNYRSLASKGYRNHCGFMEEKFAVLERVFAAKAAYDAVFYYEDLVLDPAGMADAVTRLGAGPGSRISCVSRASTGRSSTSTTHATPVSPIAWNMAWAIIVPADCSPG
jgi:hypothetical protein